MVTMKLRSLVIPAVFACSSLFSLACSTSKSDENGAEVKSSEIDINRESLNTKDAKVVAIAKDGLTDNVCVQTGSSTIEARDRALELCNLRYSQSQINPGGTATQKDRPIYVNNGTRVDGQIPSQWICLISEVKGNFDGTDKTFAGLGKGKSQGEARKAAENFCASKAGIRCQVDKCFMADDDKWSWNND